MNAGSVSISLARLSRRQGRRRSLAQSGSKHARVLGSDCQQHVLYDMIVHINTYSLGEEDWGKKEMDEQHLART